MSAITVKTSEFPPFEQFEFESEIKKNVNDQLLPDNDYSLISLDFNDLIYGPQSTLSFETSNDTHEEVPKNDLQCQSVERESNSKNLFSKNGDLIQKDLYSSIYDTTSENGYQTSTSAIDTYNVEFLPGERWENVDTSCLTDVFYKPISPLEDATDISQDISSMEEQNKIILELDEVLSNLEPKCVEEIEEKLKRSGNEVDFNGTSFVEFDYLSGWTDSSVKTGTSDTSLKNLVGFEPPKQSASTTTRTTKRQFFCPSELTQLETYFKLNQYPSKGEMESISALLDTSFKRVNIWFRNRRQKESRNRKQLKKIHTD